MQVFGYFTWGSTKILRNCYPENNELEARVYMCVHVLKTKSRECFHVARHYGNVLRHLFWQLSLTRKGISLCHNADTGGLCNKVRQSCKQWNKSAFCVPRRERVSDHKYEQCIRTLEMQGRMPETAVVSAQLSIKEWKAI